MKKFLKFICFIFMFGIIVLTGCELEQPSKVYTVNFMVDGEVWETLTSDKIEEVPTPTKQYCDFVRWDFDEPSSEADSYNAYAVFTLNNRYTYTQISSGSMSPALKVSDYIIIDKEATEFNVNDIVVFQVNNSSILLIQRIIEINDNEYTMKGDANATNYGVITKEQIVGLVCENLGQTLPDYITNKPNSEQSKIYTINFIVDGEVWETLTSDKIEEVPTPTKQYCDFVRWDFDEPSSEADSYNAYAVFTLNNRYTYTQITSGSMSPALKVGDYVIIDKEATEFNVNDIVVFQVNNSSILLIQRIIEINDNEYTMKGDANTINYGVITKEQIVGLVCENLGQTLPEYITN